MSAAESPIGRAWLLAVAPFQTGDCLNAIPCSHCSVGTLLDSSFHISTALRLGTPICAIPLHSSLETQCHQRSLKALARCCGDSPHSGAVVSVAERWQVSRWLDLVPWSHGRCLVWDFTCPGTLVISHLHRASIAACTVAVDAEDRKRAKYTAVCEKLNKLFKLINKFYLLTY